MPTGGRSLPGQFLVSVGVGVAGAAVGILLLWFLLRKLELGEVLGTSVQFACVIGVAAACDAVREDTGLLAAVLMGLVLPTLGLVAILVLVTRPLIAFLTTLRSDLTRGERQFTGWMAPRGIVAAATASTFSAGLVRHHVGGAAKILPVTFLVIAATVAIYGLTAVPVARRVGAARSARTRPLLIGGEGWVIDLARVLARAGIELLMPTRAVSVLAVMSPKPTVENTVVVKYNASVRVSGVLKLSGASLDMTK